MEVILGFVGEGCSLFDCEFHSKFIDCLAIVIVECSGKFARKSRPLALLEVFEVFETLEIVFIFIESDLRCEFIVHVIYFVVLRADHWLELMLVQVGFDLIC